MDNSVERLHRMLVNAIEHARGDFDSPVTVSQIYQELVPYRAARSAIGFEMNADYEYALLRLLAGEGDFARLEPAEVREMLRSELESPNPNVSLFREYANCDVWVTEPPAWVSEMVAEPEIEVQFEEEVETPPAARASEAERPPAYKPAESDAAEPAAERIVPALPGAAERPQQCAFCGGDLPTRLVNFCPFCGNDLTRRPCSGCGEIMEPMWRFCANCGTPAAGFDADAN